MASVACKGCYIMHALEQIHHALDYIYAVIGSPFLLRKNAEGKIMVNKQRTVEGLLVSVIGAFMSAVGMAFLGYVFLIPEIQKENAVLHATITETANDLAQHEMYAERERLHMHQELGELGQRIEKRLDTIQRKLEKHDSDLYTPR